MNYFTSPRRKIGSIQIAKCCACAFLSFILCARVRYILSARAIPEPLTWLQFLVTAVACVAVSATILMARYNDVILMLLTEIMTVGGAILGVGILSIPILSTLYQYDHGYGEYDRASLISGIVGACAGAAVAGIITD